MIAELPIVSADPATQARYEELRANGESHSFAEILACKAFPGLKTDSVWNEGRCNGNQFETCQPRGDWYRRKAEEAGVSTTGKTYLSSLAEFPGDPKAWVSDRGDVLRVAKEKGFRAEGFVNYRPPEVEPIPTVPIAPELVEREVSEILESNPGARHDDVRERVVELRTGQVDPNPLLVQD